uniref:Uncharacterized protein n=1 Tax=uncultured euryarchaeote Alv-FOS4 TaxID=337893 RepID=Q3SA84_9EURY|nr:hypothetical protein [uncultured euryarchaeote Alv-FOS4]
MQIAIYFMIYVIAPFAALRAIMTKYPTVISPSTATITMIYFLLLFTFSIITLYTKYSSIPTALSVIATIVYLQLLVSHIHLKISGAYISINMSTMLLLIYILLLLKMIVSIYSDTKQKHLSSTAD